MAVFHFPKAGDKYLSDQALGAADGLSNEYEALIEDWGNLADSGSPRDPYSGEIRQMSVSIWNGGSPPFSDCFHEEDPENVVVDLYQWAKGLPESSMAIIDRFVCQDPISTDEVSRLLRLDLVSLPMRYDGPVGDVIKLQDWPNCKEEDLGKYVQAVIGSPGYVRSLCVRTAPKATLCGSILDDTTEIVANEDLDAEGFDQAGTIQIGSERITYSSRTDFSFFISQRGAGGTIAAEHLNQEEIQQHVGDFTYVFSVGPVSGIGNLKVAGALAPGSIYTAYPELNPARVVFSEKPYGLDYSRGSSFLEMQFDAVAADNTAVQPHLAYDDAAVTSAAEINEDNARLSLTQVTANPDRGEIIKVYLAVEWWASSSALMHDRVKVTLAGAVLGYLEWPSQSDEVTIDAEVDIDHGHTHSISGEHTHTFTDPTVATNESAHGHASSGLSDQIRVHANAQLSLSGGQEGTVTFRGPDSHSSATLHCRTSPNTGCEVFIGGSWRAVGSGDSYTAVTVGTGTISLKFRNTTWFGGTQMIYEIFIDYVLTSSIQPAYTGVTAAVATSGANALDTDKDQTDVDDMSSENRELILNQATTATKSVVELFDITSTVNQDWSWFTGKGVKIEYEGDVDDQSVYILHTFFDVEFRRVERLFSDDVTADIEGLIDDEDGTYTGTPGALITRPDHVRRYLLQARGGLPGDLIDSASFDEAGARYAEKDYVFDGVIDGQMTVREAEKKLARECRSRWFWDAGKAMIRFREKMADWTIGKTIVSSTGALRIKGASMERKAIRDMLNRVNVYYYRDWSQDTTGIEAYLGTASDQDNESISAHGVREDPEGFMFDLVRNTPMANDLADFYKEAGALSTFYALEAFLPYIDLQKEDYIRLTHSFTHLQKAAMRIASVERVFGSGKAGRMNMLRIVAETWYRLIQVAKEDRVTVSDILNIEMVMGLDFNTGVRVTDSILFGFEYDETVSVADALSIVMTWVLTADESVTVTDSLAFDMQIALGDSVEVHDWLDSVIGHGYGQGGYGQSPYGSMSRLDANPKDFVSAVDTLVANLSVALSDTVTVTDSLVFSSGYGSPWAEDAGYGQTPYGR